MSFRLDRPKPVSVRYTRHERKAIEEFMKRRNMNSIGKTLRLMIRLAGITDQFLATGNCAYVKPYTEEEIETMISNLSPDGKLRLAVFLADSLGPEYVKRLRDTALRNEVVDKDTKEV